MARRAARVDANQRQIVKALRDCCASVEHLHAVGEGCPDLLVGYRGKNYLMEVKDGRKPPSKRSLNETQKEWHAAWNGAVAVVKSVTEALAVIGVTDREIRK